MRACLAAGKLARLKDRLYTLRMIATRISARSQITVPRAVRAVRAALGVGRSDMIAYTIEEGRMVPTRAVDPEDMLMINDFSTFTDWADALDAAFDREPKAA